MKIFSKILLSLIFSVALMLSGFTLAGVNLFSTSAPGSEVTSTEETIELPEGYTQVNSIVISNDSANGYLNGVPLNLGWNEIDKIEITNKTQSSTASNNVMILKNSVHSGGWIGYSGYNNVTFNNISNGKQTPAMNLSNYLSAGKVTTTYTFTSPSSTNKVIYGCWSDSTWSASSRLYRLKAYKNGELLRDLIPCINSEGVAGVYDIANTYDAIEEGFYTNTGSGTLGYRLGENKPIPEYEIDEEKYKKLEYLSNNGLEYIDTGIQATAEIDWEIDYSGTNATNLFGTTIGYNYYVFAKNNNGTTNLSTTRVKLYRFSLFDQNGDCIQNLIPVYNIETNKAGLVDTITGEFFGNAASKGRFLFSLKDAELPEGYIKSKYILNTTGYIDTGISASYAHEMEISYFSLVTANFWGASNSSNNF